MKKLLSLALALVLVLGLSVTAFASEPTPIETIPDGGHTSSENVTADYTAAKNEAGTVYYFTIKWEANASNNLKYTGAQGVYIWDGASMQYSKDASGSKDAEWTGSAAYTITVTNQSNTAIYATTETVNTYKLTLTGSNWTNETFGAADTSLVSTDENGLKTYTIGTAGSEVEKSLTYTYTARTIGADGATAPDYTAESTITVGTITVTVTDSAT